MRQIRGIEDALKKDPNFFRADIEATGKVYPENPIFRISLCKGPRGSGFAVHEEKSDVAFGLQ